MSSTFRPSNLDDFHAHHRQYRGLCAAGGPGERAWAIINSADGFMRMVVANDALDLPAIAGVAKELAPLVLGASSPDERKQLASAMGGMVRTVLVANGRRTTGVKRAVPPLLVNGTWVRVFKTGETYA